MLAEAKHILDARENVIKQGQKNKYIVNLKKKQKFKNQVKLVANAYIILMSAIFVYVL